MPFDYEVKFNLDSCIKKLGLDEQGRVQKFVTDEILRKCDPYVPFDQGTLRDSGYIDGTDVVWHTPYARRWFYANEGGGADQNIHFQGAPIRGAYWVDRMLQNGGLIEIENGARRIANQ